MHHQQTPEGYGFKNIYQAQFVSRNILNFKIICLFILFKVRNQDLKM